MKERVVRVRRSGVEVEGRFAEQSRSLQAGLFRMLIRYSRTALLVGAVQGINRFDGSLRTAPRLALLAFGQKFRYCVPASRIGIPTASASFAPLLLWDGACVGEEKICVAHTFERRIDMGISRCFLGLLYF
jgi:hypothetical protein